MQDNYIVVEVCTAKYLGIREIAIQFLNLLSRYGNSYVPEKWGIEAHPRYVFDHNKLSPVIEEWSAIKEFKDIFFFRKRPIPTEIWISMNRFEHAKFNYVRAYISDKYFKSPGKEEEILSFSTELCSIISADYGFIAHEKQKERQSYLFTPAKTIWNLLGKLFWTPLHYFLWSREITCFSMYCPRNKR